MGLKWLLFINRTPIFGWYVDWGGSKNKHHKDACLKKIGLHLRVLIIILQSIMNTIERSYYVSGLKTYKHSLPRRPQLNKGRSDFQSGFCIRFIVNLLMQHREFCCLSLIGGSWRTWKTNQILGTHIP